MRDSLKIWRSYIEAARMLSDADRLAYYDALFDYGFDGIERELAGIPAAMFLLTKPNLDKSISKLEAGAIGGSSKPEAKRKQTASKPEAKRKQTLSKPEANGNECASNKRIENREERIENIPPIPPKRGRKKPTQELPDADFDAFWALYPKKKSKGEAKKAWAQLKPSREIISAIMAKLPLLAASHDWTKEGGQYVPNPATWLRAEGWEDEVQDAPRKDSFPAPAKPGDAPRVPSRAKQNAEWMREMLESNGAEMH